MEKKSSRSKVRKSQGARRKTPHKKPKVKLDKGKVFVFFSIILSLCVVLLAFTAKLSSPSEKPAVVKAEKKAVPETKKSESKSMSDSSSVTSRKPERKPSASSSETKKSVKEEKDVGKVQKEKTGEKMIPVETKPEARHEAKPEPAKEEVKASSVTERGSENASSKFNVPEAQNGATLVIIIDDAGGNLENCRKYTSLPFPITIAVLPKLPHSRDCAKLIVSSGKELMLHQPMQALNLNLNPGPGAILSDMNTFEIAETVKENLDELGPDVKGLNNHEGSLITSNSIKIGTVLDVCNERGIYFLDSRTTKDTQAPQAALERDMHIFEKQGPYLDNVIDRNEMLKQLYESLKVANKSGKAIIIGHVDKSVGILPELLSEIYPELKEKGYRFAVPSML